MSSYIRMIGVTMSQTGVCLKCGEQRDSGSHKKCDRWPSSYGVGKGFHFIGNSDAMTIGEFKKVVAALVAGENDETVVHLDLRIRQSFAAPGREKP
jgi:hypothetical protein